LALTPTLSRIKCQRPYHADVIVVVAAETMQGCQQCFGLTSIIMETLMMLLLLFSPFNGCQQYLASISILSKVNAHVLYDAVAMSILKTFMVMLLSLLLLLFLLLR
jgi:hypothetical protein